MPLPTPWGSETGENLGDLSPAPITVQSVELLQLLQPSVSLSEMRRVFQGSVRVELNGFGVLIMASCLFYSTKHRVDA